LKIGVKIVQKLKIIKEEKRKKYQELKLIDGMKDEIEQEVFQPIDYAWIKYSQY